MTSQGQPVRGRPARRFTEEDVLALPPLPTPDHATKLGEATCGCTLVLALIALMVSTTESVTSGLKPESSLRDLGRIAVFTEAFVALFCLGGLMFGVRNDLCLAATCTN